VFFFKTIKSNDATVTVISDAMFELHYEMVIHLWYLRYFWCIFQMETHNLSIDQYTLF